MKIRNAFTMIELIFVIVVMGILSKFGAEFLAQAYNNFIFSSTNNQLMSKSASTIEFIASRLQHRIKDSVIVRQAINNNAFTALSSANAGTKYLVLEWISTDIDGFRGLNNPYWSGILDLDAGVALGTNTLVSPKTQTNNINALINALSNGNSNINDAALYFIGSNSDINGYGWNGAALANQNSVMHPIQNIAGNSTQFTSSIAGQDFTGVDVYEYFKLAWTANAVVVTYNNADNIGDLDFYYDYQPWNGETYWNNGQHFPLMEDISTFQAIAIGSIIKLQVCTKSNLIEVYSLCKEKTIY